MSRLSVLGQSPIKSGATAADAIHESLELAQAFDLRPRISVPGSRRSRPYPGRGQPETRGIQEEP
jgi:hypothetical protein